MSEQQPRFTPGPWCVHPVSARVDALNTSPPVPVCKMLWPTDQRCEVETNANARLIAAAPDLYEALQTLVDALPEDGEWGHFLDIKDAARAALAKAREGARHD